MQEARNGNVAARMEAQMGQFDDVDRPDDSNARKHDSNVAEETSAAGQRIKGKTKDIVGDLTDNESLEQKGERENQAGRDRQAKNDGI
jgi:uncharacterized protein YjbJ (UPF0337 family)